MAHSALRAGDPARIGRYRLLARLGEGGMGVVYLGTSRQYGRVAIKVIHPAYAAVPNYLSRFQREVLALGRVQSVCTVRVIESDTDAVGPYLVTEYVEGPSLQDYVTENGPLDLRSLHLLGVGLAEALAAIHQAEVVHRDLKPSNVLVTPAGPKVIDFGVAKPLDLSGITHTNGAVGTPSYMAPEQFQGEAVPATDVFAWGLTVAFAVTGQSLFGGGTFAVLASRITNDDPDLSAVPEQLRPLVASALAKDPAQRPTALNLLWFLGLRSSLPAQTTTQELLSQAWRMPVPTQLYTHPLTQAYTSAPGSVLPVSGLGAPVPGPPPEFAPASAPGVVPPAAGAHESATQMHVPVAGTTPPGGPKEPPLAGRFTPLPTVPPASLHRRTLSWSRRTGLLMGIAAAAAVVIGLTAALTANAGPGHSAASNGANATITTPAATRLPEPSATPTATPGTPSPSPTATPTPTPTVTTESLGGATGTWTIAAIDCTTPGNCTAVGTYTESGTQTDAMFVDSEVNGTWGTEAQEAANIEGQQITVNALSCASPGNCLVGGWYDPSYGNGDEAAFIAEEANGSWKAAQALGGAALPGQNQVSQVTSVACPSAGNCVAVGYGENDFVADEVDGTWGTAQNVPGLDTDDDAYVSCASAGNCALASDTYVVNETQGSWETAQVISGATGQVSALSCAPDGGCTVGGDGPWTASENGGVWTTAALLPGIGPVLGGGSGQVTGLACADGGNCDLVGSEETLEAPVGFTDHATDGTWAKAQGQFSGAGYLGNSTDPPLASLSCSSFGNCAAQDSYGNQWLYEVNGTWSMAGGSLANFAISCSGQNWCAIASEDAQVLSGSVAALADPSVAPGA
jgi:serine/threonine protein kinase